jgi:uncharacterized protein (TIGR03663 family)
MAKNSKKKFEEKLEKAETVEPDSTAAAVEEIGSSNDRAWFFGGAAVLVVASFFRFYLLALKPFHHDEGVNGWFLTTLVRSGVYKYDPQNYHGPTLYYFALASTYLFGLTDFGVRFVTALFGILIVVSILCLRRYIGTIGALTAGMLLALSPGMVFISRYFIHEILFCFFTLGVAVGVVRFMEARRVRAGGIAAMSLLLLVCLVPGTLNFANAVSADQTVRLGAGVVFFVLQIGIVYFLMRSLADWNEGRPVYLLLASASAALAFATKETAFISFGTMLIALVCVWIWGKIWSENKNAATWREPVEFSLKNFWRGFGDSGNVLLLVGLTIVVFWFVWILFFSSFFTHYAGIYDSFKAYDLWTKTGTKDHAENGLWAYLKWGFKIEAPLLVLGAIGALIAFWKARHRFAMFAALWAFGLLAAYTLIPYKTPWLALNFLMPMAIIAGYGINELAASRQLWQRATAAFLAAVSFGICAYQAADISFYRYDDDKMPYVYAHTRRPYRDLLRDIEAVAQRSGKGKDASIVVASPDYWALPWDLRDYKNAGFYGQITPNSTAEIVIGKVGQEAALEAEYGRYFKHTGTYDLRPGVELKLFVRKDLAQ